MYDIKTSKEFNEVFLKTLKIAKDNCPPYKPDARCDNKCLLCWIKHCERKIKELEE